MLPVAGFRDFSEVSVPGKLCFSVSACLVFQNGCLSYAYNSLLDLRRVVDFHVFFFFCYVTGSDDFHSPYIPIRLEPGSLEALFLITPQYSIVCICLTLDNI